MVAHLFWEQEEQFDSDILHHPLWFVDIVWKFGKQWGRLLKANQCSDNKERLGDFYIFLQKTRRMGKRL